MAIIHNYHARCLFPPLWQTDGIEGTQDANAQAPRSDCNYRNDKMSSLELPTSAKTQSLPLRALSLIRLYDTIAIVGKAIRTLRANSNGKNLLRANRRISLKGQNKAEYSFAHFLNLDRHSSSVLDLITDI